MELSADESAYSTNRRSTMKLLAVLGGLGAFSSRAVADEDGGDGDEDGGDGDEDEENDTSNEPEQPVGTEELLQFLAAVYGDQLTNDQLVELEDDVAANRGHAEALDAVDLDNGDDMATTFAAYRGSD